LEKIADLGTGNGANRAKLAALEMELTLVETSIAGIKRKI
jgi:hypothetical protein